MSDIEDGYAQSTTTISSYRRTGADSGSNPCLNICVGIVLLFGSVGLLGWNERRTVCSMNAFYVAEKSAIRAKCDDIPSSYEGKLVFLHCPLLKKDMPTYDATSADPKLEGINNVFQNVNGLCFEGKTEIYQCYEEKSKHCKKHDKEGRCKKETTEFQYHMGYYDKFIPSQDFSKSLTDGSTVESARRAKKNSCGVDHNPTAQSFPYQLTSSAPRPDSVKMGNWMLNSLQIHQLTKECTTQVPPNIMAISAFEPAHNQPPSKLTVDNTRIVGDKLYTCSEDNQKIGCLAIGFYTMAPAEITLLYEILENSFVPYRAPSSWMCGGEEVTHISEANIPFENLFELFKTQERAYKWVLRALGFFMCFASLYLIFSPIEWLAHHFPFCGDCVGGIVGCALHCFECCLATGISFITIAIVWVVMRPHVGIPLFLIGVAFLVFGYVQSKRTRGRKERLLDSEEEME